MTTTRIGENEIENLKVSSLPTRPTAPASLGGLGYTAAEMKAAFDALPLLIVSRFNSLINDIVRYGEDSLADAIPTGLSSGVTLHGFFEDVANGNLAGYLTVGEVSLATELAELRARISALEDKV